MTDWQNVDVHAVAGRMAACGFDNDVLLPQRTVAALARRLRGIDAIAAVLTAENPHLSSDDAMTLGDCLRGGLIDAIAMLADDAAAALDAANDDYGTGVGPSFEWPAQRPEKHGPPCIFDDMLAKSQEAEKWAAQGGAA